MWLVSYNFLLTFLFLLTFPFTPVLQLMGKRFSTGLWQRYGLFPQAQLRSMAGARPVWIHASSVGEVRSIATLVCELKARHPQRRILLSTFTCTGNEIAKKSAGVDAVIFLPLDVLWTVRRALTQWNPSLMIFVETEIDDPRGVFVGLHPDGVKSAQHLAKQTAECFIAWIRACR